MGEQQRKKKASEQGRSTPPQSSNIPARTGSSQTLRQTPPSHREAPVQVQAELIAESYSGPLPPPVILQQYESMLPGTAQKIIDAFVGEYTHRQMLEIRDQEMDIKERTAGIRLAGWGLATGATIGLLAVGGGLYIAATVDASGLWLAGGGLAALIGAYVRGTQRQPPTGNGPPRK